MAREVGQAAPADAAQAGRFWKPRPVRTLGLVCFCFDVMMSARKEAFLLLGRFWERSTGGISKAALFFFSCLLVISPYGVKWKGPCFPLLPYWYQLLLRKKAKERLDTEMEVLGDREGGMLAEWEKKWGDGLVSTLDLCCDNAGLRVVTRSSVVRPNIITEQRLDY